MYASALGTPAAVPTRIPPIVGLGGNGRRAQAAEAVGQLAGQLALTGQWQSSLPRDAFRYVPAHGAWDGVTLLRDQAR
jgi:hypothetical protein